MCKLFRYFFLQWAKLVPSLLVILKTSMFHNLKNATLTATLKTLPMTQLLDRSLRKAMRKTGDQK
jgi:hypothetical protein